MKWSEWAALGLTALLATGGGLPPHGGAAALAAASEGSGERRAHAGHSAVGVLPHAGASTQNRTDPVGEFTLSRTWARGAGAEGAGGVVDGQAPRSIVFILSDDHRYDFMSFHPNAPEWLETPAMDRMALTSRTRS